MREFTFLTLQPEMVRACLAAGPMAGAVTKGMIATRVLSLRDYAVDRHGSVDAPPFGGGDGMVLRPEPLAAAVTGMQPRPLVILPDPAGRPWARSDAVRHAATNRSLLFICPRFGGVDQRFVDRYVDEIYSVGDFIVSGGELPALMMADSIIRRLPGALGHAESCTQDSFEDAMEGGLEHPQYTRPAEFNGDRVPPVLLSGDHAAIADWRRQQARQRTRSLRPDLPGGGDS